VAILYLRQDAKVYRRARRDGRVIQQYLHDRSYAPNQVTLDNMQTVVERLYPSNANQFTSFEIGDKVRMTKGKHVFKRGYMQGWTDEIFTVCERYPTDPATYGVKDYDGEHIKGKFTRKTSEGG